MPQTDFEIIYKHVLLKMQGLAPTLFYHSIEHTTDVVKQSTRIALDEGVNEKEKYLLRVAALYHDTGFLQAYADHEKKSCEIFLADSSQFNFSEPDKKTITDLIMATRVPQQPKNLLQKIICDADLDYLGRTDFSELAARLKKEFLHSGIVADETEWLRMQLKFLQNHHYHTNSSRLIREPVKKANLAGIIS